MNFFNPLNAENRRIVTPEGDAGQNVFINLPFYGFWNPDGRIISFPNSEIRQRSSKAVQGLSRPEYFRKSASSCAGGTVVV